MGWEGFLLVVLLLIISVNSFHSPAFLTVENQVNLFVLSVEKIIIALIMTFIILNAEIDLSVASMMGLAACLGMDGGVRNFYQHSDWSLSDYRFPGRCIQRLLDHGGQITVPGGDPGDADWFSGTGKGPD